MHTIFAIIQKTIYLQKFFLSNGFVNLKNTYIKKIKNI